MFYNFRKFAELPVPWNSWSSREITEENLEFNEFGLSMFCRNGKGAAIMLPIPKAYGTWKVNMRISPGKTKVCLLLWPKKGDAWPPEIDFNESGDRSKSHQTFHYSSQNMMAHTSYLVDQTVWHSYGVQVTPDGVRYLLDGQQRAMVVPNRAPGQEWNLHIRTVPNGHPETTEMQVSSVRLEEPI